MNQRAAAASILNTVISQRQSLNDSLPKVLEKIAKKNDINALPIKNFDTVLKKISTKERKVICNRNGYARKY